jgi:ABC-type transport system substrate-binding protein
VVIETSRPDPFLVQTLAGRFALVQAPEAVSAFEKSWSERRAEQVIGCGPFRFDGQDSDGNLRFSAHREGHRLPPLDGIRVSEPFDEAARFLSRENDEALTRDRRDAATIRAAATELQEMRRFEDSPVITTLFVGAPPWNNFDLLKALSGALNRRELASRLFGDRAEPSSPVGPVWPAFAPSEADLASFAGFRTSFDEDAHDARAHWSAAGGAALGTVTVDFPAIFDPLYGASAVVVGMLNEVLGPQFKPAVESYITISAKALGHSYGNGEPAFWLGWGPSFSGPDPSRSLDETYRSTGPGFATTGFRSASVDRALDGVMTEFDLRTRKGATRQLALALLEAAGGGVVDWLVQRSEVFRWPYFKRSNPSPFWDQHLDAWAYLDPVGAASASRPGP